jgi:hypothetical protein
VNKNQNGYTLQTKLWHSIGSSYISDSTNSNEDDQSPGFDFDFADAISKPLPEWFQKEKEERENYIREITENRERILREFREKYEITEQAKNAEREARWLKFKAKLEKRKKKSQWFGGIFTQKSSASSTSVVEEEEHETTTREKWEKVWDENSGEDIDKEFMLPGFFEVFPELKLKWPKWARNKNGDPLRCETDRDCPFPQACCPHPIIPGDKFCCTGFGQRIMEPAYAPQEAIHYQIPQSNDRQPRD